VLLDPPWYRIAVHICVDGIPIFLPVLRKPSGETGPRSDVEDVTKTQSPLERLKPVPIDGCRHWGRTQEPRMGGTRRKQEETSVGALPPADARFAPPPRARGRGPVPNDRYAWVVFRYSL